MYGGQNVKFLMKRTCRNGWKMLTKTAFCWSFCTMHFCNSRYNDSNNALPPMMQLWYQHWNSATSLLIKTSKEKTPTCAKGIRKIDKRFTSALFLCFHSFNYFNSSKSSLIERKWARKKINCVWYTKQSALFIQMIVVCFICECKWTWNEARRCKTSQTNESKGGSIFF